MTWSLFVEALAPEFVLTIGACIVLLLGASSSQFVRGLAAPITLAVLALALMATVVVGIAPDNPPGVRITALTYYVREISLCVGALILLVNWSVPEDREIGEFFSMVLLSILGVTLTAAANDLLLLFFALELVAVPTYILVALSRRDARASEAGIKYFFLGALSAAILAYGLSFLYGAGGTTVMVGTADCLAAHFSGPVVLPVMAMIGLLLVFGGLAFKVAAVPFHAYAPDVYEGAASPVTGLLGFLPKLGGFAALVKIMELFAWKLPDSAFWLLWIVAAATMTTGNVLALLQSNVKRMLAYSSIAHSGYMLIGLLVGPAMGEGPMRDGVAALLFYIAVYGLMNLGAFALLSGFSVRGEPAETLDDLSGLSRRHPWSALGLAICVFSLMGFPPTAGFLGKVYVFSSAFSLAGDHPFHMALIWLAVIGVVNSAIGAAYYLKITAVCYFGAEGAERRPVGGPPVRVALAACSLAMLFFFAYPGLLLRGAGRATANIVSNTLPEPREVVSSSSGAVPVVELHTAFGPSVDRLP